MKKATHRSIAEDYLVAAWQYKKGSPRPVWIARDFHDLGDGHLSHHSGVKVNEGDWIVSDKHTIATTVTDEEFHKLFKEL